MGGAVTVQTGFVSRLRRFLGKPWPAKLSAARWYVRKVLPRPPIAVRLPSGVWHMAWQNDFGNQLLTGGFEDLEYAFVGRYLKQGMVVLDIGANEGYYTVLASKCVGPRGRVVGFEPSSRERRRLKINLWINRCSNVWVEETALSSAEGQFDLHVVEGRETGCNSLRPPEVDAQIQRFRVAVTTLDQFLRRSAIERVDFVKMDIEGAELSALQGAGDLLRILPRPVLLIEIYEIRTRPWGYSAREIVNLICEAGYLLYRVIGNGDLAAVDPVQDGLDANFVAVPRERLSDISSFLPV